MAGWTSVVQARRDDGNAFSSCRLRFIWRLTWAFCGLKFVWSGRLILMIQFEQPAEVQSPAQRAGIIAAFACFACLAYVFSVGEPVVEWLQVRWAGWLIYMFLPMALTFSILYGSCIHREMKSAMRALFLLLVSLLIFGGACLALGAIAFIALANFPLSRFHY